MTVLLTAAAVLPLTVLAGDGLRRITKAEAVPELIWIGVVIGTLMKPSGANWPGERSAWVVPLAIIGLAAITGGENRRKRAVVTLFRMAVLPGILVMGILIAGMEPAWMMPGPIRWSGGMAVALLIPALNGTEKGVTTKTAAVTAALAAVIGLIIQGSLSVEMSEWMLSPMYEAGRCVGNGGFEIIVAVVLTLGWYSFASMGMDAAESFGKRVGLEGKYSRALTVLLASVILISEKEIEGGILVWGCLILWVITPILHYEK